MQRSLFPALALLGALTLGACSGVSIGTGTGGGGSGSTPTGDGGVAGLKGLGCGVEAETGMALCSGVSVCPGLLVDQRNYPGCGFRVTGQSYDLQCACDGLLCPIGTPRTCAQAKALLDAQNRAVVCTQILSGRCVAGPRNPGSGSRCDPTCMTECARAGSGNCELLCGC